MNVYISNWVSYLLGEYFSPCGLEEEVKRQIQELPYELSRILGGTPNFWEQILSNPNSRFHVLNLLEGAIEKVCNQARENARRFGKDPCYYLERALENRSILRWISGYIRAMFKVEGYERLL